MDSPTSRVVDVADPFGWGSRSAFTSLPRPPFTWTLGREQLPAAHHRLYVSPSRASVSAALPIALSPAPLHSGFSHLPLNGASHLDRTTPQPCEAAGATRAMGPALDLWATRHQGPSRVRPRELSDTIPLPRPPLSATPLWFQDVTRRTPTIVRPASPLPTLSSTAPSSSSSVPKLPQSAVGPLDAHTAHLPRNLPTYESCGPPPTAPAKGPLQYEPPAARHFSPGAVRSSRQSSLRPDPGGSYRHTYSTTPPRIVGTTRTTSSPIHLRPGTSPSGTRPVPATQPSLYRPSGLPAFQPQFVASGALRPSTPRFASPTPSVARRSLRLDPDPAAELGSLGAPAPRTSPTVPRVAVVQIGKYPSPTPPYPDAAIGDGQLTARPRLEAYRSVYSTSPVTRHPPPPSRASPQRYPFATGYSSPLRPSIGTQPPMSKRSTLAELAPPSTSPSPGRVYGAFNARLGTSNRPTKAALPTAPSRPLAV
jgi:hypothetical protein